LIARPSKGALAAYLLSLTRLVQDLGQNAAFTAVWRPNIQQEADRPPKVPDFGLAVLAGLDPIWAWHIRVIRPWRSVSRAIGVLAHREDNRVQDYRVSRRSRLLRGTGGAGTLFASTWLGILVSTTAHFSGSIIGVVRHEGFLQCAGSQTILWWLGSLRSGDGHDRRDMLRAHMADGCNAMSGGVCFTPECERSSA